MKNILIAGGTGLVGKELANLLSEKNYEIALLSRKAKETGQKSFFWDYEKGILDTEAIDFADVIINLAGENISAKRWINSQKKIIVDSRVKTAELIYKKISESGKNIDAYISASAVGYYGLNTSEKIYDEDDDSGNDFLANTVVEWERASAKFAESGVRTVILRSGVVLSQNGGALPKMLTAIKAGAGSAIGSGKQYVPLISLTDIARMYMFAVENEELGGIYNAVCPEYLSNRELMRKLANHLNKPFFFPNVPAFVLKIIFGEMSSVLLKGSRVSPAKIQKAGFKFKNGNIENFLNSIKL